MTTGLPTTRQRVSHRAQQDARRQRADSGELGARFFNLLPGEMRQQVRDALFDSMVNVNRRGAPDDNHGDVKGQVSAVLPLVVQAMNLALLTEAKTYHSHEQYSLLTAELSQPQTHEELAERLANARVILNEMMRAKNMPFDLREKLCKPGADGVALFDQLAEKAVKKAEQTSHVDATRENAARTTGLLASAVERLDAAAAIPITR